MKCGDVIVKLNGVNVTTLRHIDIKDMISNFTNNFEISVQREHVKSIDDVQDVDLFEECQIEKGEVVCRNDEINDNIDDHIAEIMSGEAEILKTHNIIG